MKKWKIILPSLMITAAIPLVSLVSCGDEPDDPGGGVVIVPDFEQDGVGQMTSNKVATISIKWDAGDHIMSFTNIGFRCYGGSIQTTEIKCLELTTSHCRFQITFDQIIDQDITDGILSFNYKDTTSGIAWSVSLEDIKINKFTPGLNDMR